MNFQQFKNYFLKAFRDINIEELYLLDPGSIYSDLDKDQIIEEISRELKKVREKGITNLEARPSKCKFCYPEGSAWSFHNPETGEFVIRYVIYQENQSRFIIELCQNRIITEGGNGLPF